MKSASAINTVGELSIAIDGLGAWSNQRNRIAIANAAPVGRASACMAQGLGSRSDFHIGPNVMSDRGGAPRTKRMFFSAQIQGHYLGAGTGSELAGPFGA